jgi:dihydrolipoamide dehydrogenase
VLEALPEFLAIADQQVAKEACETLQEARHGYPPGREGHGAHRQSADAVKVSYTDAKGEQTLTVDTLVVAIGRRPFTKDLLAPGTGVQLDARGFIKVDHECRTGIEGVWAVGDCVRGPMLAHKGKEEGVMVADLIAGKLWRGELQGHSVGHLHGSRNRLGRVSPRSRSRRAAGLQSGRLSVLASGRARAMEQTQGFAKADR